MTPERWIKVKEVFNSALALAPPERASFLSEACGGDGALRGEVESLIRAHERTGSFIDSPAYGAAGMVAGVQAQLSVGEAVAHYEILSHLGSGGMGEVYLAEDKRLGRKVALKILPDSLAASLDRLRRFGQEARAASALNHPHILTIYETGQSGERHYIAAEYVEGDTLRQRLARGPLGTTEALELSVQLASALAAAHAAGIVHRDIKPENIMLRADGLVKILDFGIAKLVRQTPEPGDAARRLVQTDAGLVVGTSKYMSPEQARGREVDARTDIWSLGVVLYESLTGRAPFEGETASDVIAAVLEREPAPLVRRAGRVPETLEWIVTKALTKEREDRYQTARELLTDLRRLKQRLDVEAELGRSATTEGGQTTRVERTAEAQGTVGPEAARTDELHRAHTTADAHPLWNKVRRNRRSAVLILAALVVAAVGIILFVRFISRQVTNETGVKSGAAAPPVVPRATQITSSPGLDTHPSFSPDGNSIAYATEHNGSFEIFVKQLTPGGREIQLTSDGQQNLQPAWSPDGQRIAYFSKARGSIWVMPALGGNAKQLTDFGSSPAWSRDGSMIAFQSNAHNDVGSAGALPPSTIWVIPSQGGAARQITQQGTPPGGHGDPSWSPDGKRIVFSADDYSSSSIWSVSVEGGELKKIVSEGGGLSLASGGCPTYAPNGEDIYFSDGGLRKIQVSPTTGAPLGESVQVVSRGGTTSISYPAISPDGKRIAYSIVATSSNLWSVSPSPISNEASGPPTQLTSDASTRNNVPRFSPDGKKIAFARHRPGTSADIWVTDADGRNPLQLTTNPASDNLPSWFPDGDRIAFFSNRGDDHDHYVLWAITLSTGREEPLLDLGADVGFVALSPDGQQVAFNSRKGGTINVWTAALDGGEPKQLTFDKERMGFPCWSPDGKYLAVQARRGNDENIALVPSAGGTPVMLTADRGLNWPHSFSPDGDRIAFAGFRNGVWNIYWVSRSTHQEKQLTNYTKLNTFVRYPAWSPLGDRIVYEYAERTGNVWMIELK
jgi:Tol biopolymer transport system component/serine/threonine protein kinase